MCLGTIYITEETAHGGYAVCDSACSPGPEHGPCRVYGAADESLNKILAVAAAAAVTSDCCRCRCRCLYKCRCLHSLTTWHDVLRLNTQYSMTIGPAGVADCVDYCSNASCTLRCTQGMQPFGAARCRCTPCGTCAGRAAYAALCPRQTSPGTQHS